LKEKELLKEDFLDKSLWKRSSSEINRKCDISVSGFLNWNHSIIFNWNPLIQTIEVFLLPGN